MRNDYLNFKKEVIEKLLELVKKYLGRYTLAYGLTDADLLQFANEILEPVQILGACVMRRKIFRQMQPKPQAILCVINYGNFCFH